MKDGDVSDLILLPRRVVQQPTPLLNASGDCGACVLGGLTDLPLADVYAKLQRNGPRPFARSDMIDALHDGCRMGFFERCYTSSPSWTVDDWFGEWGNVGWMQSGPWHNYVRLGFEAGCYAIAEVRWAKDGPLGGHADHWVLLCGARTYWKALGEGFGDRCVGSPQILVSCSSRTTPDEEWVEPSTFLRQRGGFNVLLVRPPRYYVVSDGP